MTTTTIIIVLAVAVLILVVLVASLIWHNMRQSDELQQKNNVIVREVQRRSTLEGRVASLFTLLMALAMGIGMVSCVDNIDNSTKPSDNPQEQQAQQQQEKAQKYWAIVSHLVDVDDFTDDYEDKTFEPVYGVSEGNDGTRYVFTNDAATAAARFADLVDRDDIDENTQTYTYDDPDVGKLVYTKGTGRILATVDVDIKQIPSLKKIVYVPGAYSNGNFRGRAYYRFGDVVSRIVEGYPNGEVTEYWICVRPAFGLEGKGDSHWVCLNVLPKNNVWFYHSDTNDNDYYLPTRLGTNEEHAQNLAEMLYAIYWPGKWERNLAESRNGNGKLKMFHDFSLNKSGYHNMCFWTNVQEQWRENGILEKAFNYNDEDQSFKKMLEDDGLRLLYSGYSWWPKLSWNCSLYEAHYQNGTELQKKNMHTVSYTEPHGSMQGFAMDCRMMGQSNRLGVNFYDRYKQFFNEDGHYRWTIRHATGKELAAPGTRYDKQRAIEGVEEVYRYYHDVEPTDDNAYATTDPEETAGQVNEDQLRVGYILSRNGQFYKNYDIAEIQGGGAMAMVVYLGENKRVEKGKDWNGLAIALKDLEEVKVLEDDDDDDDYDDFVIIDDVEHIKEFPFCEAGMDKELCSTSAVNDEHMIQRLDGWAMTKRLKDHACNPNHKHPAAELVWKMEKPEGSSEWFIPSTGQWNLVAESVGYGEYAYDGLMWLYSNFYRAKWPWDRADVKDGEMDKHKSYMTTTERNTRPYAKDYNKVDGRIRMFVSEPGAYGYIGKTNKFGVRPFVAFKYGNGGSEDPAEPWAPLEEPKAQSWLGEDGQFYEHIADAFTSTGYLPVGYVAYYGAPGSVDVNGYKYRGIIIGTYANEFAGLAWVDRDVYLDLYETRLPDNVRKQKGFSKWFIGSKEHWKMALEEGFGLAFENNAVPEDEKGSRITEMNELFSLDLKTSVLSGPYWTDTTEDNKAIYIDLIQGHAIEFLSIDQTDTKAWGEKMRIRPMMAF